MSKQKFGEYLISKGILNDETLTSVLLSQQISNEKIGQTLVKKGIMRKERLNMLLADYFGMVYMSLGEFNYDSKVASLIPQYIARKLNILPLNIANNILEIAVAEPLSSQVIENIKRITGKEIITVFMEQDSLDQAFEYVYKKGGDFEPANEASFQSSNTTLDIKNLCEQIINKAVVMGASDIHFEPEKDQMRVRFRVDGLLKTIELLPESSANLILSRLKVNASMNITEKKTPQDGAFYYEYNENGIKKVVNARVSTIPSLYGEKAVLRIQTKGIHETLESLGFEADHLSEIHKVLQSKQGIFLTTGPSGSGKTTTLYSALRLLRADSLNIVTIEDPIERPMLGVIQTEVEGKYNFQTALKSILRQDPDIIMIGEIRDGETARLAMQAAITGHLVISTLHTNDSTSAIAQLIDMGCEQFLVNSAVNAVLAQRLVRVLCPDCKQPYQASAEELLALGLDSSKPETFYKSEGCPECRGLQYRGRIGIYELLVVDSEFKKLVTRGSDLHGLRDFARGNKMRTLREDGIIKMRKGLTSFAEVIAATTKD